jgi:hypothetical protein
MLQAIMNLLNTIIQIITSIGQAFIAAWNDGNAGQIMLQAIMTAITNVVSFVNSIGQAFIVAWNQAGLGESIMGHIISIITNIVNAIGNISQRLQEAWEKNNNGVQIWEAILGIVDSILGFIDRITEATAQWAAHLNFEPLMESIKNILQAIKNLADSLGDVLGDLYENIVLPMLTWVIQTGLPGLVNFLASVIQLLRRFREFLLWDCARCRLFQFGVVIALSLFNLSVYFIQPSSQTCGFFLRCCKVGLHFNALRAASGYLVPLFSKFLYLCGLFIYGG